MTGIGLLEVIHKITSQIINTRLNNRIEFSQEVHGFRRRRECHTAIREAKIRMQMAACRSETMYHIYLDLRKVYDSIDRNKILRILEKY